MEEEEIIITNCEVVEMPPPPPLMPPLCPHGPTMLFTKEFDKPAKKGRKRKLQGTPTTANLPQSQAKPYYACSATRDLSFCSFRIDQHKWATMQAKLREEQIATQRDAIEPADGYAYFLDIFDEEAEAEKGSKKSFAFCHDCGCILLSRAELANIEGKESRDKHCFDLHLTYRCLKVTTGHPKSFFAEPTKLLRAATDNAGQAQYFFADSVAPFIVEEIARKGGFTKVLCIGCPTIHEHIVNRYSPTTLSSFLLDIDARFRQFWPPEQFAQFNMFNYFFFNGEQQAAEHLSRFFHGNGQTGDTLVVVDPPFGGLIENLAASIRRLQELMTQSDLVEHLFFPPLVLFFPYFNEHWISKAFNGEVLLTDQIVQYANHHKFSWKRGMPAKQEQPEAAAATTKHWINASSPVRVFTNLNRAQIDLSLLNDTDDPPEGGAEPFYRWCDLCNRYVFRLNQHCPSCDECTARDATKKYAHCDVCNICVKCSWFHCQHCARCHLKSAPCTA